MSAHVHVPWKAPQHPASVKPLLEGLDLASPVRSGCMYKEAHTHVVFHKRFFVLFPRVLVYYEKEADYKRDLAKGSLEVSGGLADCLCVLIPGSKYYGSWISW